MLENVNRFSYLRFTRYYLLAVDQLFDFLNQEVEINILFVAK